MLITSIWLSRLNVIRAIRDLPEPEARAPRMSRRGPRRRWPGPRRGTDLRGHLRGGGAILLVGPAFAAARAGATAAALHSPAAARDVRLSSCHVWEMVAFQLFPDAFDDAAIPAVRRAGRLLTAAAVCTGDAEPGRHRRLCPSPRRWLCRCRCASVSPTRWPVASAPA